MMEPPNPVLQIVHISDLHITDSSVVREFSRRARLLSRIAKLVTQETWLQGTAPYAPNAIEPFKRFLIRLKKEDSVWRNHPAFLIDTGDLTTFGDKKSLHLGKQLFQDFATTLGADKVLSLHGNHDAWPGEFPLFVNKRKLESHRKMLRTDFFPQSWPEKPHCFEIPGFGSQIQIYGLNSVIHERFRNSRAIGEVKQDRYWENGQANPLAKIQLRKFANLVKSNRGDYGQRHFRILAIHHPIHYPPPVNRFQMVLQNDKEVAKYLNKKKGSELHPLAHLVLSGHTHSLFPKFGTLPRTAQICGHADLSDEQCQMIVGTLMQSDPTMQRGIFTHQCVVLRFYISPTNPNQMIIERLLAARINGTGDYRFIELPGPDQEVAENILMAF